MKRNLYRAALAERYGSEIEMKATGIIGELGLWATVDFFKGIATVFNAKYVDLACQEIIIYTVNIIKIKNC